MALLGLAHFDYGHLGEAISTTTVTISSSVQYGGHNSLKCLSTAGGTSFAEYGTYSAGKPTGINNATVAVTVRWRFAQKPASGTEEVIVFRHSAGNKISARLTSSSVLKLVSSAGTDIGFGTTVLTANQWYLIELSCGTGTSAPYTLKINGVTELSGTVTLSTSNTTAVRLGKTANLATQVIEYYFSQLLIDSTTLRGADAAIAIMYPNGNTASAQWSGGTGVSGYLEIDDVVDDSDTTYIAKSAASSQTSQFDVIDAGAAGISGTILGLYAHLRGRTTAGTSATSVRFRQGSSNSDSTAKALGTTYESLFSFLTTNPDTGGAFTVTELNSAQVGAVDTAPISSVRCTSLSIAVAFIAASGITHDLSGATLGAGAATLSPTLSLSLAGQTLGGSGTATLSPTLSLSLTGQALGGSGATGRAGALSSLSGAVAGGSGAAGELTVSSAPPPIDLSGEVLGAGNVLAGARVVESLSSDAAGGGSVSGTLRTEIPLSGGGTSGSELTGEISFVTRPGAIDKGHTFKTRTREGFSTRRENVTFVSRNKIHGIKN